MAANDASYGAEYATEFVAWDMMPTDLTVSALNRTAAGSALQRLTNKEYISDLGRVMHKSKRVECLEHGLRPTCPKNVIIHLCNIEPKGGPVAVHRPARTGSWTQRRSATKNEPTPQKSTNAPEMNQRPKKQLKAQK